MTPQPANWVKKTKTSHLILFIAIWLISTGLLLFVITDSFTDYSFSRRHTLLYLMMAGATWTTSEIAIRYFRNRK
ncbi:MAG: hypothetical protein C0523_10265 [Cytophaga sp.]|nr:hypothetical protein [Cytophaga sp.]